MALCFSIARYTKMRNLLYDRVFDPAASWFQSSGFHTFKPKNILNAQYLGSAYLLYFYFNYQHSRKWTNSTRNKAIHPTAYPITCAFVSSRVAGYHWISFWKISFHECPCLQLLFWWLFRQPLLVRFAFASAASKISSTGSTIISIFVFLLITICSRSCAASTSYSGGNLLSKYKFLKTYVDNTCLPNDT